MNKSLPNAREIESLTFIYDTPGLVTLAERNRRSQLLNGALARLRKRIARPAPVSSAVEWSALGL